VQVEIEDKDERCLERVAGVDYAKNTSISWHYLK
jgi:hypothetical protein